MAYGRRDPSVFDNLTLSPLPYPVLLILAMVIVLLGFSWSFSYEDFVETAEEKMSWALLLVPVGLLLLIRLVSSADFGVRGFLFPFDRREYRRFYDSVWPQDAGGASPWGVAAALVVLIVLASFHSTFLDMWGP
ncbi:hypothetical protein HPP92_020570 [Vanilla planifolia]|uniref:Uncharacterized protein n=1 Tax=Vanilla planifolia TaxID=51239 RepID=A0A835UF33_VANPL|nr:hypothetical protein HPP92_020971 [Vanilla planifolia]KAG0462094.1 hypothetical protein HPP92_020570 [Vanilla planifolia]